MEFLVRAQTPPRRLATVAQAAEYAACSPKTVRRYISAGTLTGYRMGKRLIRVDLNELDRLLRPIPSARSAAAGGHDAASDRQSRPPGKRSALTAQPAGAGGAP